MIPVISALTAALLAAFGPWILRLLPEPELEPAPVPAPDLERDEKDAVDPADDAAVAGKAPGAAKPDIAVDSADVAEVPAAEVAAAEPAPDKILYAELGARPNLWLWLAIAAGIYGGVVGLLLPEPKLLPVWIVLAAVGVLLAYIDWHTHLLPYLIVAPTWIVVWVLTALSAWWLHDWDVLKHALYGNLAVFGGFWILYLLAKLIMGGAFGYGDVRLSAVLGVVLGPLGVGPAFVGIYGGFILGAIVGIIRQRGRLGAKVPLAFGPFMILGALFALLLF